MTSTNVFKVCLATDMNLVMYYDEYKKDFDGFASFIPRDMMGYVAKSLARRNISLEFQPGLIGLGSLKDANTGEFSGCIGKLQRNESNAEPKDQK